MKETNLTLDNNHFTMTIKLCFMYTLHESGQLKISYLVRFSFTIEGQWHMAAMQVVQFTSCVFISKFSDFVMPITLIRDIISCHTLLIAY